MAIRSRRLSKDNTYDALKQKIIDSELEPNQPVHEENLAALLGVSRTPLRGNTEIGERGFSHSTAKWKTAGGFCDTQRG